MKRLTPLIRRLTAPNSNPMTGPGTNTYLVGRDQLAIIDPGPVIESHLNKLLEEVGPSLRWILVTHTHPDHSPAAAFLAEKTGAQLIGCVAVDDGHQDMTFQPDQNLEHGWLLQTGEFTLEAIHTPGHVDNQYCFLLSDEKVLFTGDHIMQGSSVVIIPPSGDMADYIESTRKLQRYDIAKIAPGHGEIMGDPFQVMEAIIRHRLMREQRVVSALKKLGESSLEKLLPEVYSDINKTLYGMAKMSLWAHLLKLEKEGRATKRIDLHWAYGEEHWVLL